MSEFGTYNLAMGRVDLPYCGGDGNTVKRSEGWDEYTVYFFKLVSREQLCCQTRFIHCVNSNNTRKANAFFVLLILRLIINYY